METRRDESKRRAITQAFVNPFTRGLGKWKEWLYRLLSALSAWWLLSNIVLPKTNMSSTVIMRYIPHLISGTWVGPRQPCQLPETYMRTKLLVHIIQWILMILQFDWKRFNKTDKRKKKPPKTFSHVQINLFCLWKDKNALTVLTDTDSHYAVLFIQIRSFIMRRMQSFVWTCGG